MTLPYSKNFILNKLGTYYDTQKSTQLLNRIIQLKYTHCDYIEYVCGWDKGPSSFKQPLNKEAKKTISHSGRLLAVTTSRLIIPQATANESGESILIIILWRYNFEQVFGLVAVSRLSDTKQFFWKQLIRCLTKLHFFTWKQLIRCL